MRNKTFSNKDFRQGIHAANMCICCSRMHQKDIVAPSLRVSPPTPYFGIVVILTAAVEAEKSPSPIKKQRTIFSRRGLCSVLMKVIGTRESATSLASVTAAFA